MTTLFLLSLIAVMQAKPAPEVEGKERLDKSKAFSYTLPDDWTTQSAPQFSHDIVLLPKTDARNRNILIVDQPGESTFAELKQKYERDLPKAFKDFKLVSSELVELKDKKTAIRIIHTNTHPGVPVRQVNYIIQLGHHRYFVTCTAMVDDDDKYDSAFASFVDSINDATGK